MSQPQDLGSFMKETRKLVADYVQAKVEVYRLQGVKAFSKTAGYLIWLIISLFLLWLLIIFGGIVTGLWLSELTHSYVTGFGLTTLIILFFAVLIYVLRKTLFINPLIRLILQYGQEEREKEEEEDND